MSLIKKKRQIDSSFSTQDEINAYVNFNMNSPIKGDPSGIMMNTLNDVSSSRKVMTMHGSTFLYLAGLTYYEFTNPFNYNGQSIDYLKETYKNNKYGFFIGAISYYLLFATFMRHRRYKIISEKKRFVYQQYLRKKFIEESLRINKSKTLEYKDYFIK